MEYVLIYQEATGNSAVTQWTKGQEQNILEQMRLLVALKLYHFDNYFPTLGSALLITY